MYPDPYYLKNDQQTQTEIQHTLQVKDTGAQYSSPSDSDDSSSSDFGSDIEGTENITVAKRYLHRHFASSEDLYTNPTLPHKRFRTSTPEPFERQPEKEPIKCPLKEIINHRPALRIPPVDLIVAPGRQAANVQLGRQQLNAMAGRGRNQPQPQPQALQGADPALVQILQMMQNRDANRDNSHKQFSMFETESPNWLTEDQMKQAFLKRFNPWGDMRHQQQDAWNKLKFDMTKDDIDSFVVDMKTLASILGHNDDVIMESSRMCFLTPTLKQH